MAAITEEKLKEIFDSFDADKSGEISARELVNAVAAAMTDKSEDDVKAIAGGILSKIDRNEDGKVSWQEFKTEMHASG